MTPLFSRLFFTPQKEFRISGLFLLAVLVQGIAANWYTPVLEVIWDMVFFKGMAHGLHYIRSFDLRHHFPVPPLYPLLISPGFFASDYLTVEWIQSWINPIVYFLGLYPTYYFARRLLDAQSSALVCLLYAFYPSAVYTQWSMSENLAAPLVMWVMVLATHLLTDARPRMREGTWLGIAIACLALTRIFLLVFCIVTLAWIAYRTARRNRYPAPVLMAFSLSLTLIITTWWLMGYFTTPGPSLIYSDFSHPPVSTSVTLFLTYFSAHWMGLWMEGGFLITVLLIVQWLTLPFSSKEDDDPQREMIQAILFINLSLVGTVAGYYVKRTGIEPWSISLRYIFYGNLIALPVVVAGLGKMRHASWKIQLIHLASFVLVLLLFCIGFWIPETWQKLSDSHAYFTNAPSLDFIYQLRNEGSLTACGVLFGISVLVGILFLYTRRTGAILLCGMLLYLQCSALEHIQRIRKRGIVDQSILQIHDFCKELQKGSWRDITIYCEENVDVPHLIPNLIYWVQRGSGNLPPEDPRPALPYLLVTVLPVEHPDGEKVFESGNLKAYLYAIAKEEEKKDGQ